MRITLDTNAIIALESNEGLAPSLRELIAHHRAGRLTLCVSAIAASEHDRNEAGDPNFSKFMEKLARADLADVELLDPPLHWDVCFWDHFVFAELDDSLEPSIQNILFGANRSIGPDIPGDTAAQSAKRIKDARNALCDVLTMWCHIRYCGDVFISDDANFHKATKKPRLIELGAGQILRASEALAVVRHALSAS